MNRLCLIPILLVLAGCAGSGRDAGPLSRADPRYCESLGLGIGSDPYAECRLRQQSPEPGR